jgi:hypothetical protein
MRTEPVKYSAGPLVEACEPFLVISTVRAPSPDEPFAWSAWASTSASRKVT